LYHTFTNCNQIIISSLYSNHTNYKKKSSGSRNGGRRSIGIWTWFWYTLLKTREQGSLLYASWDGIMLSVSTTKLVWWQLYNGEEEEGTEENEASCSSSIWKWIMHITCIQAWEEKKKKKVTISNEFHFTSNVVSETCCYGGGGRGYPNNEERKGEEEEDIIIPTYQKIIWLSSVMQSLFRNS